MGVKSSRTSERGRGGGTNPSSQSLTFLSFTFFVRAVVFLNLYCDTPSRAERSREVGRINP